jgi:hypothetical protein
MKKSIFQIMFFVTITSSSAFSQSCWFTEWGGHQPIQLNKENKARLFYDEVLADTSCNWNILFIRFGGLQNDQKTIFLKSKEYQASVIKLNTMGLDSNFIMDSLFANKLYSIVTRKDSINGFYAGDCDKLSAHESELIVIKNYKLNKWIEAYSARGDLQEVLQGKKEYGYLLALCEFINTVAK